MLATLTHLACSTCGFDRTGQIGSAAEGSIVFLLAVVFFLFSIFGYTIFSFARRCRRLAAAEAAAAANSAS